MPTQNKRRPHPQNPHQLKTTSAEPASTDRAVRARTVNFGAPTRRRSAGATCSTLDGDAFARHGGLEPAGQLALHVLHVVASEQVNLDVCLANLTHDHVGL